MSTRTELEGNPVIFLQLNILRFAVRDIWGDGSDSRASHSYCGPWQGSTTTGASEVMMHSYCLLGLLFLAPYSWKSWQFFQVQPWLQDQEFWKFLTWKYHEKPSLHIERDWAHTPLTLVVKKRRKKRTYFDFLIK